MRLFIVGATGRTGRLAVEQAIASGHAVTIMVRNPQMRPDREGQKVVLASVPERTPCCCGTLRPSCCKRWVAAEFDAISSSRKGCCFQAATRSSGFSAGSSPGMSRTPRQWRNWFGRAMSTGRSSGRHGFRMAEPDAGVVRGLKLGLPEPRRCSAPTSPRSSSTRQKRQSTYERSLASLRHEQMNSIRGLSFSRTSRRHAG